MIDVGQYKLVCLPARGANTESLERVRGRGLEALPDSVSARPRATVMVDTELSASLLHRPVACYCEWTTSSSGRCISSKNSVAARFMLSWPKNIRTLSKGLIKSSSLSLFEAFKYITSLG